MMIAAALALALFGDAHFPDEVQVRRAGAWRVVKRTDRFTGAVTCAVSRGKVVLRGPLAVLDVGLSEAAFTVRLDNGPAFDVDAGSGLDPLRVSPDVAVENPSGGELALPLERIWRTRWVWVRTGAQSWPRRYEVSGAEDALTIARQVGCPGIALGPAVAKRDGT